MCDPGSMKFMGTSASSIGNSMPVFFRLSWRAASFPNALATFERARAILKTSRPKESQRSRLAGRAPLCSTGDRQVAEMMVVPAY